MRFDKVTDCGIALGNPRPRVEQVSRRAENPEIDLDPTSAQRFHPFHRLRVQCGSGIVAEECELSGGWHAEAEFAGQPRRGLIAGARSSRKTVVRVEPARRAPHGVRVVASQR